MSGAFSTQLFLLTSDNSYGNRKGRESGNRRKIGEKNVAMMRYLLYKMSSFYRFERRFFSPEELFGFEYKTEVSELTIITVRGVL